MRLTALVVFAACSSPAPVDPVFEGVRFVGVDIADFDSAFAWYRDVLGLQPNGSNWYGLPVFTAVEIFDRGTASATPKDAALQSADVGFRVGDLVAAMAAAEVRGVVFVEPVSSDGTDTWRAFVDLDGNRFSLVQRGAATAADGVLGVASARIFVERFDEAVAWYTDVLGLSFVAQSGDVERSARFATTDGTLIDLRSGGTAGPARKPSIAQPLEISLRVQDLDGVIAELELRGADVRDEIGEWESAGGWPHERATAVFDPEGNKIGIREQLY